MVMKTNLCHMLGIEHPIIAAPMGPDQDPLAKRRIAAVAAARLAGFRTVCLDAGTSAN